MGLFGPSRPNYEDTQRLKELYDQRVSQLAEIAQSYTDIYDHTKDALLQIYYSAISEALTRMDVDACLGDLPEETVQALHGRGRLTIPMALSESPIVPEVLSFIRRLVINFTIDLNPEQPAVQSIYKQIRNGYDSSTLLDRVDAARSQLVPLEQSVLNTVRSRARWFGTGRVDKERILDTLTSVRTQQEGTLGDEINSLYAEYQAILRKNSTEFVSEDFGKNPDLYYSVLNKIEPSVRYELYRKVTGETDAAGKTEWISSLSDSEKYGMDFVRSHNDYVRKPDSAAAIEKLRYARSLANEISSLKLDERDYSDDAVKAAVAECMEDEAEHQLSRIKTAELGGPETSIDANALTKAGYKTLSQVRDALNDGSGYQVAALARVGIWTLRTVVDEIEQQVRKNARLRLNADNKTPRNTELVKILYKRKQAQLVNKKIRELQTFINGRKEQIVNGSAVGYGSWSWRLLPRSVQETSLSEYSNVISFFETYDTEPLHALEEEVQRLSGEIPDSEAWDDFSKDPAVYFLLLEPFASTTDQEIDSALDPEVLRKIQQTEIAAPQLRCSLYGYQKFAVQYILNQGNVLLGDEMGLGKTIEAIAVMAVLANRGKEHFLVVCPLSVLVNWDREVATRSTLPHLVLRGKYMDETFHVWMTRGGVGITTFETLQKLSFPSNLHIDLLIVDEAHYVKNPDANRSKAVMSVQKQSERTLYMSGTPLENRLSEMTYLIGCLQDDIAREIRDQLRRSYMISGYSFRHIVAPVYLRRKREEVAKELPDLIEEIAWCGLEGEELISYREAVYQRHFMKMRQISWDVQDPTKSSKGRRLLQICDDALESGRKVLVFSFFKHTLENARKLLGNRCIGVIDGSVSVEKRQGMIDALEQAPDGAVLAAQIMAGGTGLNIQAASVVILCEPQIKPSIENQAVSRAYRTGQSRNVLVYRLMCEETVDEQIYKILEEKQALFDRYADKSEAGEASLNDMQISKIIEEEIRRLQSGDSPHKISVTRGIEPVKGKMQPPVRDPDIRPAAAQKQNVRSTRATPGEQQNLKAFFMSQGFTTVDKRPSGGCLWVVGDETELEPVIEKASRIYGAKGGFGSGRATGHRRGWYTKSTK